MSDNSFNARLQAFIIEVVEKQILEKDPLETAETYHRLMNEGCSSQEAKEKIGSILVERLYHAMKDETHMDMGQYVSQMRAL